MRHDDAGVLEAFADLVCGAAGDGAGVQCVKFRGAVNAAQAGHARFGQQLIGALGVHDEGRHAAHLGGSEGQRPPRLGG